MTNVLLDVENCYIPYMTLSFIFYLFEIFITFVTQVELNNHQLTSKILKDDHFAHTCTFTGFKLKFTKYDKF
jgi:hypothetical protein